MKTHTDYLTFNTKKRQEIIDITDASRNVARPPRSTKEWCSFRRCTSLPRCSSTITNPGLWKDILDWLEQTVAPWEPDRYRHNSGTGEDNAAAHLRSITVGHEVIVPVTAGRLDLGPWQRIFYGEWDGQRAKRVILKAMGD